MYKKNNTKELTNKKFKIPLISRNPLQASTSRYSIIYQAVTTS